MKQLFFISRHSTSSAASAQRWRTKKKKSRMFYEQHIGSDMNWKICVCVDSHLQQSCVGGCHEMKLLRTSHNNGTTYTYLERVQVRLRTLFNITVISQFKQTRWKFLFQKVNLVLVLRPSSRSSLQCIRQLRHFLISKIISTFSLLSLPSLISLRWIDTMLLCRMLLVTHFSCAFHLQIFWLVFRAQ